MSNLLDKTAYSKLGRKSRDVKEPSDDFSNEASPCEEKRCFVV